MFHLMYAALSPQTTEQHKKVIELITDFVPQQPFGLIPFEINRYVDDSILEGRLYDPNNRTIKISTEQYEKYTATPHWQLYSKGILQGNSSNGGKFLHNHCGQRNLLSRHIKNQTRVLANSKEAAISRIFFEIDEFFLQMVARKDVAKGCGYGILKNLYDAEKKSGGTVFVTLNELMERAGYSNPDSKYMQSWYISTKINTLKDGDIGLLIERDSTFGLTELARSSFKLMEANSDEMRRFPYRVQWFYPTEKSKGMLSETGKTIIRLK